MIGPELIKFASGCGVTDYIVKENARDFCDLFFALGGIVLILALVYLKKIIFEKQLG